MSSKQKKILGTATAVILVLALGLAGTFAASGSTESDGNIEGTVDTSIVLHDDFSLDWTGDVRDRDVYVENSGDSALYVRMRLDEFMTYGGKTLAGKGGMKDDTSKWKPHIPLGADISECDTEVHNYFTIQMGNETGVKYKPGTINAYKDSVAEADKTATSSAAEIVLIEDYLNAEEKPNPCWIVDNKDGYAYWYTRLQKDKATGLILNSITNTGFIDESYYYGINARAEAVTETDLNAWFHGTTASGADGPSNQASKNAVRLLKNMSPKYIEITQDMKDNGASDFDSDNDGYLTKNENIEYEAGIGVTQTPIPAEPTLKEKVKKADVGTIITVANAETTYGAATDWQVIFKDEAKGESVLMTTEMLTVRKFHSSSPYPLWKSSDLRNWLNSEGSFAGTGYMETLDTEFVQCLKTEEIKTARFYGLPVTVDISNDKVYLLTETRPGNSLVGKNSGDAESINIVYLKCEGKAVTGENETYWWLRSPRKGGDSTPNDNAAIVSGSTGGLNSVSVIGTKGVRPAVTINWK